MSIQTKFEYLLQTKQDIRAAIESKGVEVRSDVTFREYVNKILEIAGGDGLKEIYTIEELNEFDTPIYNDRYAIMMADIYDLKIGNIIQRTETPIEAQNVFLLATIENNEITPETVTKGYMGYNSKGELIIGTRE